MDELARSISISVLEIKLILSYVVLYIPVGAILCNLYFEKNKKYLNLTVNIWLCWIPVLWLCCIGLRNIWSMV